MKGLKFIKSLFEIRAYSIEDESSIIKIEEEEDNIKENVKVKEIYKALKKNGFDNVIIDNNELDDESDELEKLIHFSFMSLDGSSAYASDYKHSRENEDEIPITYDGYMTTIQLLINNQTDKLFLKENGFTKNPFKEVTYEALIQMINDEYWKISSF